MTSGAVERSPERAVIAPVAGTTLEVVTGEARAMGTQPSTAALETQLVRVQRPLDAPEPSRDGEGLAPPRAVDWQRAPAPLLDPRRERAFLRELCATKRPSHRVDVEKLVEAASRIEVPLQVPLLETWSAGGGARVLVDRGGTSSG
ncbi:MAG: hypothetical protein IPG04_17905 [Polyangiaceae bacterium]|nr:hypothetical protein [Polyangiaceae bacterium]